MRKLDRTRVPAPLCLRNYLHGTHTWEDLRPQDKQLIRESLEVLQGRRCAYCEGSLDNLGQHIEHFWRKAIYPQLTFDWSNLYWSCGQNDSCGHFKDNGAGTYNINDIIKPCLDQPDKFFRFRTDGTISIRAGLTIDEQRRAKETLRVFSLNPEWGRLRNMRKTALSAYVSMADDCLGLTPDEIQQFFSAELVAAEKLPFFTAIRHILTEQ